MRGPGRSGSVIAASSSWMRKERREAPARTRRTLQRLLARHARPTAAADLAGRDARRLAAVDEASRHSPGVGEGAAGTEGGAVILSKSSTKKGQ